MAIITGKRYFKSGTSDTGSFTTVYPFGFLGVNIIISNDSSNSLNYSFDGTTLQGTLLANETIELREHANDKIYFNSTAGGDAFRVWAW